MKLYWEQPWYHVLCPYCRKADLCVWLVKYSAFSCIACQPGCTSLLKYSVRTRIWAVSNEIKCVSVWGWRAVSVYGNKRNWSLEDFVMHFCFSLSYPRKRRETAFFFFLLAFFLGSPPFSKSNSCRNNFSSYFQNWIRWGEIVLRDLWQAGEKSA